MEDKLSIAKNWLPRYTGMPVDGFGDSILLTNFADYIESFCERFSCDLHGEGRPMQAATNSAGLSIINFGIGLTNGTRYPWDPQHNPVPVEVQLAVRKRAC